MKTLSRVAIAAICCGLLLAVVHLAAADSPKPEGKMVNASFALPKFKGKRLDWCKSWATNCGEPAAEAWCRSKNFDVATKFTIDEGIGASSPTILIGTGQVCDKDFCDGFKVIECRRYVCPAGAKDKCCYGKEC